MQTERTITAETTIPLGANGTGTATAALNALVVQINSTTWANANNDFKIGTTAGGAENLWLYVPSTSKCIKINNVDIQLNQSLGTVDVFIYIDNTFGAAFTNEPYQVVNGNLRRFYIYNPEATVGTIATNGGAGSEIASEQEIERVKQDTSGILLDVVVVDGAKLLVQEETEP